MRKILVAVALLTGCVPDGCQRHTRPNEAVRFVYMISPNARCQVVSYGNEETTPDVAECDVPQTIAKFRCEAGGGVAANCKPVVPEPAPVSVDAGVEEVK